MTCRDALQREAELRKEQQQEADATAAKKVEEEQDEARAAFRAERARQRAGLAVGIAVVVGILFLIAAALVSDPLYRWTLAGFGAFTLVLGLAGIGTHRKQADGTKTSLMGDMASGLGLLLGRRQAIGQRLLFGILCIVPFVGLGIGGVLGVTAVGGFGIGVAVAIALAVVFRGAMQEANECPLCWTQGSAVFDGIEDLGAVAVTTRTYETSSVYKGLNKYGLPDATIKTPVERTRLVRRQARNWHCTACGHRWRR